MSLLNKRGLHQDVGAVRCSPHELVDQRVGLGVLVGWTIGLKAREQIIDCVPLVWG